ncbi:AP-1 complex subunit sigma-2 isoform X2 [Astyanax mexicanus]|uniref:AP complex subunit sigma n=1 Tax=Astyanax mexicanus TaxID=7994 RepID=A0A8T2LEG2_ASTMX|nr:AP-1 complex subunit sigma-2 isoform X2 [Astyanax mexicanus]
MQFMLLFSRQGKLRLQKWYVPLSDKEKKKITRELVQTVLARKPKMCSFLEWRDLKIVYKRYASLYFCCAIEDQDNELITLEIIHRYVELLDKYFGSVGVFLLFTLLEMFQINHSYTIMPINVKPVFSLVFLQVCELDIIFNFEKAYFILDEFLLGGEAQETSKKNVLKAIEQADLLQEDAKEAETPRSVLEEIGLT